MAVFMEQDSLHPAARAVERHDVGAEPPVLASLLFSAIFDRYKTIVFHVRAVADISHPVRKPDHILAGPVVQQFRDLRQRSLSGQVILKIPDHFPYRPVPVFLPGDHPGDDLMKVFVDPWHLLAGIGIVISHHVVVDLIGPVEVVMTRIKKI